MTSLLDVMVVLVLFLLPGFSPPPECGCWTPKVRVPWARNAEELIDAPFVAANGAQVLVDGIMAGETRGIAEEGRVRRLDELTKILAAKRALWKEVQPHKPFPGVVVLELDGALPSVVVRSVFFSAVRAGYPNVSFLVRKLGER